MRLHDSQEKYSRHNTPSLDWARDLSKWLKRKFKLFGIPSIEFERREVKSCLLAPLCSWRAPVHMDCILIDLAGWKPGRRLKPFKLISR